MCVCGYLLFNGANLPPVHRCFEFLPCTTYAYSLCTCSACIVYSHFDKSRRFSPPIPKWNLVYYSSQKPIAIVSCVSVITFVKFVPFHVCTPPPPPLLPPPPSCTCYMLHLCTANTSTSISLERPQCYYTTDTICTNKNTRHHILGVEHDIIQCAQAQHNTHAITKTMRHEY